MITSIRTCAKVACSSGTGVLTVRQGSILPPRPVEPNTAETAVTLMGETPMLRFTHVLAIALLASLAMPASGQELFSAGNSQGTWLILQDGPDSYRVIERLVGGDWQPPDGEDVGHPAAAAAVGQRLRVLFASGDSMLYFSPADQVVGLRPPPQLWRPGSVLLAATENPLDLPPSALVLLWRPRQAAVTSAFASTAPLAWTAPPMPTMSTAPAPAVASMPAASSPATASAPSSEPAGAESSRRIVISNPAAGELVLLRCLADRWEELVALPETSALPRQALVRATRQATYVLLYDPSPALWELSNQNWRRISLPPGPDRPLDLEVMGDQLVIALFHPADGGLRFARRTGEEWSLSPPVQIDSAAATTRKVRLPAWSATSPPAVARWGDQLALAWKQQDQVNFAIVDTDGRVSDFGPLPFGRTQEIEQAQKVQQIYLLSVLGLTLVLLFSPGQTPRQAMTFSLPPQLMPARLSKRAMAFLIDAVPFLLISLHYATAAYSPEQIQDDVQQWSFDKPSPAWAVYGQLTFMTSYTLYCIISELLVKTTLGKRVMRLRVVGDGGGQPSARDILLRNVFRIPEITTLFIVPVLFILLTRYHQRLGDKAAWTAVIDVPASLPVNPPDQAGQEQKPDQEDGQE